MAVPTGEATGSVHVSGPKGGAYQVVSAAEQRRRALAAARQAVADVLRRVAVATEGLDGLSRAHLGHGSGLSVPRPPADDDLEGLRQYAQTLERMLPKVDAIRAEISAHRARELVERAGPLSDRRSISAEEALAGEAQDSPASAGDGIAERVQRLLARMPTDAPQQVRARAEELSATVLQRGDKVAEFELRRAIELAVERSRARAAAFARAEQLRTDLAPYADDPDAAGMLSDLTDVLAGRRELTNELGAAATRTCEEARQRRDQAIAASAVADALDEMGYEVEHGFSTLVVQDGVAHARHPAVPDYAVRWRLRGDRLVFHLVRQSSGVRSERAQQIRDEEAERAWCTEVDAVLSAIAQHGVTVELDRRTPAGEHAVVAVDDLPFHSMTDARRHRRADREQAREH